MAELALETTGNLFDELRLEQAHLEEPRWIGDEWFHRRLVSKLPQHTGVFPFDVRWVSDNGFGAIFEVPPGQRMITFTNTNAWQAAQGVKKVHTILVYVPRTVIGVSLDRSFSPVMVWNFIIDRPITMDNQYLYSCPLPNVYWDGHICLPSSDRRLDQSSFADGLLSAYESVWDTRYNTDLLEMIRSVRQDQRPKAIWDPILADYHKRIARRPSNRYRAGPHGTPLQIFNKWKRLTPAEVMAIQDWPRASAMETVRALKDTISRFNTAVQDNLFLSIRESVGF